MRRTSSLLAFAAILLTAAVAYTYKLRLDNDIRHKVHAAPQVRTGDETVADRGWVWDKDDPQTNKPVVRLRARSVRATKDPSTFELHEMALRLYEKTGATYTYVRSGAALYDEKSRVMRSEGPVTIIRNVPADKDAENQNDIAKLVQIQTSGVTYETQTGKAESDRHADSVRRFRQ